MPPLQDSGLCAITSKCEERMPKLIGLKIWLGFFSRDPRKEDLSRGLSPLFVASQKCDAVKVVYLLARCHTLKWFRWKVSFFVRLLLHGFDRWLTTTAIEFNLVRGSSADKGSNPIYLPAKRTTFFCRKWASYKVISRLGSPPTPLLSAIIGNDRFQTD